MGSERLRNIRYYLLRHGRYLEVARWNFLFEEGSEVEVLKALKAYQNRDGGFGRSLLPDYRNPESSVIETWFAGLILREIGFPDMSGGMIRQMLAFFDERIDFSNVVSSERVAEAYMPWWYRSEDKNEAAYDTLSLAGFVLRHDNPESSLYARAQSYVKKVLSGENKPLKAHEISQLLLFCEDMKIARRDDLISEAFKEYVRQQVQKHIEQDPLKYRLGDVVVSPDRFIMSRKSPFYSQNQRICDFYARYIEDTVLPDGYWPLKIEWEANRECEHVLRDWRGILTVHNMLYLQGMKPSDD